MSKSDEQSATTLLPIATVPTGNYQTAPEVLLFDVAGQRIVYVESGYAIAWLGGEIEWKGRHGRWGEAGYAAPDYTPTHWLPMPLLPAGPPREPPAIRFDPATGARV